MLKIKEGAYLKALTKNKNFFEGTLRKVKGSYYILNKKTKTKYPLNEVYTILKEDDAWNEELEKFKSYYANTYDSEKVNKESDETKGKIADEYLNSMKDAPTSITTKKDDFKKSVVDIINNKNVEDQIAKGNSTVNQELEKLKKDPSEQGMQTAVDKLEQSSMTESRKRKKEDVEIYIKTSPDDEVYVSEFDDQNAEPMSELDYYDSISNDVDDEVEVALDEVGEDALLSNEIVPLLAEKFDVDGDKALEESESIPDAILHIAEQVKMKRVQAFREKRRNGRK